jgi:hypothetical protein
MAHPYHHAEQWQGIRAAAPLLGAIVEKTTTEKEGDCSFADCIGAVPWRSRDAAIVIPDLE